MSYFVCIVVSLVVGYVGGHYVTKAMATRAFKAAMAAAEKRLKGQ